MIPGTFKPKFQGSLKTQIQDQFLQFIYSEIFVGHYFMASSRDIMVSKTDKLPALMELTV